MVSQMISTIIRYNITKYVPSLYQAKYKTICQLKHWNPHQVEGEDNFNPHKQGMTLIMGVSMNGRFLSTLPGVSCGHQSVIKCVTLWLGCDSGQMQFTVGPFTILAMLASLVRQLSGLAVKSFACCAEGLWFNPWNQKCSKDLQMQFTRATHYTGNASFSGQAGGWSGG